MAQTRINPRSQNYPYLEAGTYGPGAEFDAECEVMDYQCPAEEPPRYDPDGDPNDYAFIYVQVRRPGEPIEHIREHQKITENSGSKMLGWLTNLGVDVAEDGTHDDAAVPGLKCIVECAEPRVNREDPTKKYTRLRTLIGV